MKKSRHGFTLTELLVVIVIFGLMTAFFAPLLANYQVDAKTTGCRSNLRQIGMIMHAYARDRADGEFPLWRNRSIGLLNNQYPLHNAVRHLATNGYVNNTRIWVCPADQYDGPDDSAAVGPAENFLTINSLGNISYVYMAGHRLGGPENPATSTMLADESNEIENGSITPGNMPPLDEFDNHGDSYRNVLYLDGHVGVVTGAAVNAIFNGFVDAASLQAVN